MRTLIIAILLIFSIQLSAQWQDVSTGKIGYVGHCWAVSPDTVYATGMLGEIYRSFDGGLTFDSIPGPFTRFDGFTDLQFTSAGKGYVCGGTYFGMHPNFLATTNNAGQSWDSLTSNQFSGQLFRQLSFINDSVGFILGDSNLLLKTVDGGLNFTTVILPSVLEHPIDAVYFLDEQTGFLSTKERNVQTSTRYRILKTTDFGQSWTEVYKDSVPEADILQQRGINAFHFTDAQNGLACANNGWIMRTSDGGNNWIRHQLVNDTSFFFDMHFVNDNDIYVMSRYAFGGWDHNSWVSTDGGLSFYPSQHKFISVSFANDQVGYAIENNRLFKTTNRGDLSVKDSKEVEQLQIYPNPVGTGKVFIRHLKKGTPVMLFDQFGRKVMCAPYNTSLDISHLTPGIYMIRTHYLGRVSSCRLMVRD